VDWIKSEAEKEIYLANYSRKISEFSDDINDVAELVKVLTEWRMHLGIKDDITASELQFCAKFIKDEYGNFSIEKIKLAVKYSLKGELKCDIKPYGAFSPLYISTILNAYTNYSRKIEHGIMKEKERLELKKVNEPKVLTAIEQIESRRSYLNWYTNRIANNEPYLPDYNNVMWNYLTKNGFLDPKNMERRSCRKYAEIQLKRVRNPFEIDVTPINEWEQLMRYRLHIIFFRYLRLKFTNQGLIDKMKEITDEQIMM
jgi:hypothetical protein